MLRDLRFSDPVMRTAASSDDRSIAVQTQSPRSRDSRVAVVRVSTGRVLQRHTVQHGFGDLHFSGDGRELVALGCCHGGSTVVAWDTRTGRRLFDRNAGESASAIDVTPDSRTVGVATQDGKVLFLDARNGKPTRPPLQAAAGNVAYLAFAPNGRSLAVGAADNAVSLWDLDSRKRLGNPFGLYPGTSPRRCSSPTAGW